MKNLEVSICGALASLAMIVLPWCCDFAAMRIEILFNVCGVWLFILVLWLCGNEILFNVCGMWLFPHMWTLSKRATNRSMHVFLVSHEKCVCVMIRECFACTKFSTNIFSRHCIYYLINVKLCMTGMLTEFYSFIPLSDCDHIWNSQLHRIVRKIQSCISYLIFIRYSQNLIWLVKYID